MNIYMYSLNTHLSLIHVQDWRSVDRQKHHTDHDFPRIAGGGKGREGRDAQPDFIKHSNMHRVSSNIQIFKGSDVRRFKQYTLVACIYKLSFYHRFDDVIFYRFIGVEVMYITRYLLTSTGESYPTRRLKSDHW